MTEKQRESVRKVYRAKKQYVDEYKATQGCPCGEHDPVVLDLHHIAGKHEMLRTGNRNKTVIRLSWPNLKAELVKCQVLCANCHRRAHA